MTDETTSGEHDFEDESARDELPEGQGELDEELPDDSVGLSRSARLFLASLVGVLLAGTLGGLVWNAYEPLYESSRLIQIRKSRPYIAFPSEEDDEEYDDYVRNQMAIIRSRAVLDDVVRRLNKEDIEELQTAKSTAEAVEWIASGLKIGSVGGSEIYRVSFEGPNPDDSQRIVNAVIEEYDAWRSKRGDESHEDMRKLLDDERDKRRADLKEVEQRVRDVTKKMADDINSEHLIFPNHDSVVTVPDQFTRLQSERSNLEIDREMLILERSSLGAELKGLRIEVDEQAIEEELRKDKQVQKLRGRLAESQAMLAEFQGAAITEQNSSILGMLQSMIAMDEELLAKYQEELRLRIRERKEEQILAEREKSITEIDNQIDAKKAAMETLDKRIEEYRGKLDGQSDQWWDLQFAQADLARARGVYERVTQRLEAMQTEDRAPGRIEVIGPPAERGIPITQFPYVRLGAACALGFALPFLGVALGSWRRRRRAERSQDALDG